jgi:hypothetical protein
MPSRGQRFRASRLRAELPKDLLQCHNAWTEGVAVVSVKPHEHWKPADDHVKPKISGEVLQVGIGTGADRYDVDGLPPGTTMRVSVTMQIRGHPGRVRKNPLGLAAVLAVADDEGNEQRVKLHLKAPPISLEDAPHTAKAAPGSR